MARRIGWDDYFLRVADDIALRGDCTRRQVGAVLVNPDHKIISTGYNGAPPGKPGCLSDGACPRGRHYELPLLPIQNHPTCNCGQLWPCAMAVPPGSSYDTRPGACIALHAEINACLWAGQSTIGSTIYLTHEPCAGCVKVLSGAQVVQAIWPGGSMELCKRPHKQLRGLAWVRAKAAAIIS